MPTSVFLAKLIGPLLLVVGAALVLNTAAFRVMAQEFLNSRALIFVSGFIMLPAGLAIVLTHNVWTADWRVLITLLGWLTAIGGALRMLAPQQLAGFARARLDSPWFLKIAAAIWLVVGALLCYFGYLR
jgi:hypothetical protein